MTRLIGVLVAVTGMFLSQIAVKGAVTIPVGVHLSIPMDTVINIWGWRVVYQDTYSCDTVPMATVFADVNPNDFVMLAAKPASEATFTLLAAALATDVRRQTPLHGTHVANGVNWYYNGWSMGFALDTQSIYQSSADIVDAGGTFSSPEGGAYRLSWHTSVQPGASHPDYAPQYLNSGWRAGETIGLHHSDDWERYVLVAQSTGSPIPEPSTLLAWLGLGGMGLLAAQRRGKQSNQLRSVS